MVRKGEYWTDGLFDLDENSRTPTVESRQLRTEYYSGKSPPHIVQAARDQQEEGRPPITPLDVPSVFVGFERIGHHCVANEVIKQMSIQ